MKLEEIATFVSVADAGSISEAARRTGQSKSQVSHKLIALERDLEVKLAHRTSRRLGLTDAGRAFYERAVRILAEVAEARAAVAEGAGELAGSLRVAVPMSLSVLHLGPALFDFMGRHPKLELSLDVSDRRVDLVTEGFDLGIRVGELADSTSLIAGRLAPSRKLVVASPDYGLPSSVPEIDRHACIGYTQTPPREEWRFIVDGRVEDACPRRRVVASNGDLVCQAAEAGLGLAFVPTFLAASAILDGRLVAAPLTAEAMPNGIFAVYPENRHLSGRVRALVDFLVDHFGPEPPWDTALAERGLLDLH